MSKVRKNEALEYHAAGRPGKLEVTPTKPYTTQRDLSLAYSPGVAEPCLAIAQNPEDVYKYTIKGNLVAVISNGTAVLGLGDLGPLASKPVMEGKAVLFKVFADIDCYDIEIDATDPDEVVRVIKAIAPTFGGINLEDFKAPEAFEIEEKLKKELDIPVMHDDQHGTAIISAAALLNSLELAKKKIEKVKIVVSGAGAAAISCLNIYLSLGVAKENIIMFDSKGVVNRSRKSMDVRKAFFATDSSATSLSEALIGADVFLGLSQGNILTAEMVKSMAKNPIVFALANPDPEIAYHTAKATRDDIILATGRSDHPNQVNNVLGFPFIFRGALDVRANCINEAMKLAAVRALAELAKEPVPNEVIEAYGNRNLKFGRELIIPKPMDPRLITRVASAVARAAMESGVARKPIADWDEYKQALEKRLGLDSKLMRGITERALASPKRVVFAEAESYKVLKAAEQTKDEGFAVPILLGKKETIEAIIEENMLDLKGVEIIDPKGEDRQALREEFGKHLFAKRQRKGMTLSEAVRNMRDRNHFGAMLVETGKADALISGLTRNYGKVIRPALQIIGMAEGCRKVAGMYIVKTKTGPLFFADTTVNVSPSAEELVDITLLVADAVRKMQITPVVALLSYANFGSAAGVDADKVRKAVSILHREHPDLTVDGELQANFAMNPAMLAENFPFSRLRDRQVNTLIFPNLAAGNIAYKLMQEAAAMEAIGPVLLGMRKSFHILQMGCSVREIINMVRIAVVDAGNK